MKLDTILKELIYIFEFVQTQQQFEKNSWAKLFLYLEHRKSLITDSSI